MEENFHKIVTCRWAIRKVSVHFDISRTNHVALM